MTDTVAIHAFIDTWERNTQKESTAAKERTLTNLYNKRPDWLDQAHKRLDTAVFTHMAGLTT